MTFASDTAYACHADPTSIGLGDHRHHAIRAESINCAETDIDPFEDDIRRNGRIPSSVFEALRRRGFMGLLIPTEYGGRGLDCLARILNVQYIARACPDVGATLQIAQLGTGSILEYGSPDQKKQWLPPLASGERICTIAITEEHSGSHVLGMGTTFEPRNGGYILNGVKCFIGNGPIANLHVVYARQKDGTRLSAFIVEGERPGVDNQEKHETLGLKAFPFGQLKLKNVEVPKENLLGEENRGQEIAYRVIGHHGRPSLAALALGIHHRVFDVAYAFASTRSLYGAPISTLADVRAKIFDIYQKLETCRQSAYEAAYLESSGQPSFRALALAKFLNGEQVCQSALIAADLFGARAGLQEYEIGQLLLDAMMTRPPSGTGDVQRRRVTEHLFGEKIPPWERGATAQDAKHNARAQMEKSDERHAEAR